MAFTIRRYAGPDDLPGIEAIRTAVHAVTPETWMPGPDTGAAEHDPYCLIVEDGGAVAYGWTEWWVEADGTRLLLLLGYVDPARRRHGIGQALLDAQIALVLDEPPPLAGSGPYVLGGNADADQPDARDLLMRNGFRHVFTVVELECDLAVTAHAETPLPAGLVERPITEADHSLIHAALEECFATGSHAHVPRTYEQYRRAVAERQSDLGLWCVAWDGDRIAGVVINEANGDGTGLTTWVAVRAPWRRRGLAAAMVGNGLARCADAGLSRVRITTILENRNDTVTLYQRLGYREVRRLPRYRRPYTRPA